MTEDNKKQRVIHTRVSETMEEELKSHAEALGLSVSNLVRNVLSNTLGLVEGIVADGAQIARSARGEAVAARPVPAATPVLAWQPAVLNLNAVCCSCNAVLAKGSDAAVALTAGAGPAQVMCTSCLDEVRNA